MTTIIDTQTGNKRTIQVATVAEMVARRSLVVGDIVETAEYADGAEGGNRYEIVTAATGTADGGVFIDVTGPSTNVQAQALWYNDERNILQFGADNSGSVDAATIIGLAEASLSVGDRLVFPTGTYKIDSGINLNTDRSIYQFDGCTLSFGTATGTALTFGPLTGTPALFDASMEGTLKVTRTHDTTGTIAAATALTQTGILFRNVIDFSSMGVYAVVLGFGKGYHFLGDATGCSVQEHGKLVGQNCLVDFEFEVAATAGSFTSALTFYGARNIYNQLNWSDNIGSVGVNLGTSASPLRSVDNIKFFNGNIEAKKLRKVVFGDCESCDFHETYWDPGSQGGAAGTPVQDGTNTGGSSFLKAAITGASISASNALITKTAHGIAFQDGDMVLITSATNPLDERWVRVDGPNCTVNIIATDEIFISNSTSDVEFTYYGVQFEFTIDCVKSGIFAGASVDENTVSELIGGHRNWIFSPLGGMKFSPLTTAGGIPGANLTKDGLGQLSATGVNNLAVYQFLLNLGTGATSAVGIRGQANQANTYIVDAGEVLFETTSKTSGAANGTASLKGANVAEGIVDGIKVDGSTTTGDTRLFIYDIDNATMERVTVGAADSGGSGFKLLRIAN